MRKFKLAAFAASTILAIAASSSIAQTTPSFRVPIGNENAQSDLPAVYAWLETISNCSTTCGAGTRTTSYQCHNVAEYDYSGSGYGIAEPDSMCNTSVGPRPSSTSASCTVYSGCSYTWVRPPVVQTPKPLDTNPVGRVGCGFVNQKFSPYCQRGGGSTNVILAQSDHKFCSADLPSYSDVASGNPDALGYDRDVTQINACNTTDHEWRTGTWSGWSSTCDTTATSTRSVTCYRRFDNSVQPDSACSTSARPASSRTEAQYASCSYSYSYSAWSSWSNTCSTSATRSRTATCVRSNNGGQNVAASECSNRGISRNPISETAPQYGSCSYEFRTAAWGGWSSGCDTNASRNRDVWCERSNGDRVADSECNSRGRTKPAASESSPQYDACGYSWSTGAWGGWNSGCSNAATRSRSVSCTRSNNGGQTVSDAECTNRGLGRPASAETSPNYSGCSYEAVNWSGFSSCQNGTHTRTAQCRRSDGAIVGGPECANRGVPVTQTTNCTTYSWSADSWSGWSACSFGEQSQTRNVRCMGSDGSIVSDSMCTGGKPATSQSQSCQAQCSENSPILRDQRCLGGTFLGEFERNVRGTGTCMRLCAQIQGTSCVTFRTKKEREEGKTHTDYQCRCYGGTTQTYADGGSNMSGGDSTDVSTGRSTNYNSMVCQ